MCSDMEKPLYLKNNHLYALNFNFILPKAAPHQLFIQ